MRPRNTYCPYSGDHRARHGKAKSPEGPGLKMVRDKIAALTDEINRWEPVTLGADFPDA